MVVGMQDPRIPAFTAVEIGFLPYFRIETGRFRGRFFAYFSLIRPFLTPRPLASRTPDTPLPEVPQK